MDQKGPGCFEFGAFRFIVRGGDLSFAGDPVELSPKLAKVLTVLLRNAGRLVVKENFIEQVWEDTFVEDANLTNCMSKLRKIFKARDPDQEYIRTLPRRGYSFECEARACDDSQANDIGSFIRRHGYFEDYNARFAELIPKAREIKLLFIHSRRWREANRHSLIEFLTAPDAKLTVFLPNLDNRALFGLLRRDFVDGPNIRHYVKDSYQDFANYSFDYPGKVSIRPYDHYPTYSFYRFDELIIAAMYPTVAAKRQVPTFEIHHDSDYWSFFEDDLKDLLKLKPLSKKKLLELKNLKKKGPKNARVAGSSRLQQKPK